MRRTGQRRRAGYDDNPPCKGDLNSLKFRPRLIPSDRSTTSAYVRLHLCRSSHADAGSSSEKEESSSNSNSSEDSSDAEASANSEPYWGLYFWWLVSCGCCCPQTRRKKNPRFRFIPRKRAGPRLSDPRVIAAAPGDHMAPLLAAFAVDSEDSDSGEEGKADPGRSLLSQGGERGGAGSAGAHRRRRSQSGTSVAFARRMVHVGASSDESDG